MLDDARDVIERGLLNSTEFAPAHIVLARILCQQGDYQGSEASFQQALNLDNRSLAALVGFSRLNILLGNESRARELLLEARDQSPADSVINKLLLSLPTEPEPKPESKPKPESEPEPAIDEISDEEELVAKESTSLPLASVTLAELYLQQGLGKEALEMYRRLSVQKPNDLMLRRKIRALEDQFDSADSDGSDDGPSASDVSALASPVIDPAESQGSEDLAKEIASESEGADLSSQGRVLETLNLWLDNIQQRRGDV